MKKPVFLVLTCLALCGRPATASAADQGGDSGVLHIDPLLIAQAAEVWTVIARSDNPVWQGWDATSTPLLFYLPGIQDVLINHPTPPEGFQPYTGPIQFPGGSIHVRTGKTIIALDGQNTALSIEGTETLVVADTLSNRKSHVASLIRDATPAEEKIETMEYAGLSADPYATLEMIAHEAFHVHQRHVAPGKAGNELALTRYPVLQVANNVGFAREGRTLAEALRAGSPDKRRTAAILWLAARKQRRANLKPEDVAYEDGTEFLEGLAKYVEYRLTQVLEGKQPGDQMKWIQGFRGYGDLCRERERMIDMMVRHMRGDVNVNNDPYGASPLRMRLYFSGMAIAALLDALEASWKEAAMRPDTTLTTLAEMAVAPQPGELERAMDELARDDGLEKLTADKRRLHDEGMAWITRLVTEIERGACTSIVIDYSQVNEPRVALSFTPFGVTPVDEDRTVFRLVPIRAKLRDETTIRQTRPSALLQDRKNKQIVFQLAERLSPETLLEAIGRQQLPSDTIDLKRLSLPGAELELGNVGIRWEETRIVIVLR